LAYINEFGFVDDGRPDFSVAGNSWFRNTNVSWSRYVPMDPVLAPRPATGVNVICDATGSLVIQNADGSLVTLGGTPKTLSTTAPLNGGGTMNTDLTIAITQATTNTNGYLSFTDWNTFSAKMTNPMSALGDIIYGGTAGAPTRLNSGSTGTVLHGGSTPTWSPVIETDIALSNNSTNDASTTQHGFLQKLTGNPSAYLRADGAWATPAGVVNSYTSVSYLSASSKNVIHNFGAYPMVQCISDLQYVFTPASIKHNSVNDFTVTFVSSSSGTIVASVGSPQAQSVLVVAADTALSASNRIVECIAAGKTLTLPFASGNMGREFILKNYSSGSMIVAAQAGEFIDNDNSWSLPGGPPYYALTIYSNGTGWRVE
jgi:hypothetical protein